MKPARLITLLLAIWSPWRPVGGAEPIEIVCSIKPVALILAEVLPKSAFRLTTLAPLAASAHYFELKTSDAMKLSSSPWVFYLGKSLDSWILGAKKSQAIALMSFLPEHEFLYIKDEHTGRQSPDPHFWLDPLAVKAVLPKLTENLCGNFESHCPQIKLNNQNFSLQLQEITKSIGSEFAQTSVKGRGIITAHDFLGYFARRFEITYLGSIEELPGKEAGPKKLISLIELAKSHHLKTIFSEPQIADRSIKNLAEAAKLQIIALDPVGASKEIKTYADLIRFNAREIHRGME
ncbi:MAG: hypothetical protein COV44_04210 [Deltaproteobacteria bacterium CG11_big_fil_rev_8_21_14_0_20_45_16]|nr:MAG: hypothetical protein COV44_04210 [Deltaproteobacteria bacterium CG11_big_fil_rev_8_21_14_0_20_45_16]